MEKRFHAVIDGVVGPKRSKPKNAVRAVLDLVQHDKIGRYATVKIFENDTLFAKETLQRACTELDKPKQHYAG